MNQVNLLRQLMSKPGWVGSELAAEMYVDDRVDRDGRLLYIDRESSVSGARRDEADHVWDGQVIEEQYRRFLNEVEVWYAVNEVGSRSGRERSEGD